MALSIGISAEIITKIGKVEGFELPDGSIMPFNAEAQEAWVIHPEETKSGTCEECAALAGQIFNMGEGPTPPVHPHCACERVPQFPTYNPGDDTWNMPSSDKGVSITISELENMNDTALESLVKDSDVDEITIIRAKKILARRKADKHAKK